MGVCRCVGRCGVVSQGHISASMRRGGTMAQVGLLLGVGSCVEGIDFHKIALIISFDVERDSGGHSDV